MTEEQKRAHGTNKKKLRLVVSKSGFATLITHSEYSDNGQGTKGENGRERGGGGSNSQPG